MKHPRTHFTRRTTQKYGSNSWLARLANVISQASSAKLCPQLCYYGYWKQGIEFNRLCTSRRTSPRPWACQSCTKPCPWARWPTTGSCSSWLPSWALTAPPETPTRAWTPSRTCCSSSSDPAAVGWGGRRREAEMKGASAEKVTGFRVRKVSPPPCFTLRPLLATSPQLVLEKAASRVLAHLCHTRLFISLPTDEEEEEDGPMHEDRLWTLTQAARLLSVTQTGATSSLRVAPVGSRGLPWAYCC